eukprot:scaffold8050_cov180-Amphora_coffeaeformis.AAC.1
MSYATISRVIETWEIARRTPNFNEKVGVMTLLKLFEIEPLTKQVFDIEVHHTPTHKELQESGHLYHAIRMFEMFDAALNMLGPDLETLNEVLTELGKRHIGYGVKAVSHICRLVSSPLPPIQHYFPFMKHALFYALRDTLGSKWTPAVQESWTEVYEELSGAIMKSILIG